MTTKFSRFSFASAGFALVTLLSACGGGGGADQSLNLNGTGPQSPPSGQQPPTTPTPTPTPTQAVKPPVVLAETFAATINQENALDVLANDSHPDRLKLELVSVAAPLHGSAVIKNGAISYTPAAGYAGEDKLSYVVRAVGGTATATGELTVVVGTPLRLAGKLSLLDGVDSTVTVKVGGRAFTQTVINERFYEIPVVFEAPDAMVTITVQPIRANDRYIKMITLAGTARSLLTASAGTGRVHDGQVADLNVSLVSSGRYIALRDANTGLVPANQNALDVANGRINQAQVFQVAAMMRLATRALSLQQPALPLPAGVPDTLELVQNEATYAVFAKDVYQNHADLIEPAKQELQQNAFDLSVPSLVIDRERVLILDNGLLPSGANPGLEVRLAPGGVAQLSVNNAMVSGTWSKDRALDIAFNAAPTRSGVTVHGDTGTFTINSVKLRQVTGGPNHGLMAVTSIGSFNYIGRGGATAEPYEETVTYAFDAWDSLPALAAQDISGKSFGGAPVLSAVPSTGLSRIAFAANGTAVMLEQPGMSVNWSIVDGKLHLVFGNGTVYDMARATNLSLNTQRWLVRYSTPTEMRTYGVNMVEMQPGLAFSAVQAAQTWSLGISDLSGAYFIKLRADLNGLETILNPDGTSRDVTTNSWLLDNGRLVINVYRRANGSRIGVCPPGETCTLQSQRDWTLLRDDGNSITVLDNYTNQSNLGRVLVYYHHNL